MITQLRYSSTNTYLISGEKGSVLFDTGWAGTFPLLCRALGENKLRLQDISCVVISHFHPDHMGIAQQIADNGAFIAVCDVQLGHIHDSDSIFERDKRSGFVPIDDGNVKVISAAQSRQFLKELGINGEIIHTPGHSDDSISLWIDDEKTLFVGDLPPLYELELYKGTQVWESWQKLLALKPERVCYGHAKTADLTDKTEKMQFPDDADIYALVKKIIKLVDKGCDEGTIAVKTGADAAFIRDVSRMYVTHPGVSVQGILDRIEIKDK